MTKGERTRQHIVETAAALFNQRGYAAASVSDVMEATGLQKGGIYGHFGSKDELALEAFEHAVGLIVHRIDAALTHTFDSRKRLVAVAEAFESLYHAPPLPGGCALFNAAIECDDGDPDLRTRVQQALRYWEERLRETVHQGILRGELRPLTDPVDVSTVFIGLLEGALVLSRLQSTPDPLRRAVDHLKRYVADTLSV